jgi:dimeric dUTPase (all-alpha-NTP-PPase superfamily)
MTPALSLHQAQVMLRLQSDMNVRVDTNWVQASYPYLRAVVIEAAEAIEHHGWKWWKKQVRDLPQLQMELVDIWHFLLSEILLREKGDCERSLQILLSEIDKNTSDIVSIDGTEIDLRHLGLLEKLELLIALSAIKRIELAVFSSILSDCEMSWQELYRQYVGKNVLNFFRQDHGYKEGTYNKIWSDREDNEHLVEIMSSLSADTEQFPEQLYSALKKRYPV